MKKKHTYQAGRILTLVQIFILINQQFIKNLDINLRHILNIISLSLCYDNKNDWCTNRLESSKCKFEVEICVMCSVRLFPLFQNLVRLADIPFPWAVRVVLIEITSFGSWLQKVFSLIMYFTLNLPFASNKSKNSRTNVSMSCYVIKQVYY